MSSTDRQKAGGLPDSGQTATCLRAAARERGHLLFRFRTSRLSYFGSGLFGGGGFLRYAPPPSRPAASKVQINDQQNSGSPSIPHGPTSGRVIIRLRNNERVKKRIRRGNEEEGGEIPANHLCDLVLIRIYTWRLVYMSQTTDYCVYLSGVPTCARPLSSVPSSFLSPPPPVLPPLSTPTRPPSFPHPCLPPSLSLSPSLSG